MSAGPGSEQPRWRHAGGGFGRVLAILIASLVVGAVLPTRLSSLALGVLVVALWLAVARAAGLGRRARRTGAIALGLVAVGAAAAAVWDSGVARSLVDFGLAAAVAGLAVVIGRALMRDRLVTVSTVAGVLSLYLLIGMFFAQAYIGAFHLDDGAFAAAEPLSRFDLVYFSFIALTTVGFGDITPMIDPTRALAATEAVLGQIFLVTVVARAVSLLGQERPR